MSATSAPVSLARSSLAGLSDSIMRQPLTRRVPSCRLSRPTRSGVVVQVEPEPDGEGDAEAAERDPGPRCPPPSQGTVGGVDVAQGLKAVPDRRDAGQDSDQQAEDAEGEGSAGAGVEGARGDLRVRVDVNPGVRTRRVVAEGSVAGVLVVVAHDVRSLERSDTSNVDPRGGVGIPDTPTRSSMAGSLSRLGSGTLE